MYPSVPLPIALSIQYDDGQMEDCYDEELALILVAVASARPTAKRKRRNSRGK